MSTDVKAMCDRLVDERREVLLATPDTRARYAAYLARLETTHPHDPAMAAYVERSRRLIDEREAPRGDQ